MGSRFLGRKAQRRAISIVFSIASGRSANCAAISAGGLEAMLARQAAAVVLRNEGAIGDAEQRVMRLDTCRRVPKCTSLVATSGMSLA